MNMELIIYLVHHKRFLNIIIICYSFIPLIVKSLESSIILERDVYWLEKVPS